MQMEQYTVTQLPPLLSPHQSSVSLDPALPRTGILRSFKLASQKISDLTHRSSPCKRACSYHSKLSLTKSQIKKGTIPTKVPKNQRVTLPPLQDEPAFQTQVLSTVDNVSAVKNNQPMKYLSPEGPVSDSTSPSISMSYSNITNCSPLLCSKRLDFGLNSPHKKSSSVNSSISINHSYITCKWKAAFSKVDSYQNIKLSKLKPVKSRYRESVSPPRASIKQSPGTQSKILKRSPLSSSTPAKSSRWQPFFQDDYFSMPSSGKTDAMCSDIFLRMTSQPESCMNPEAFRQRTRNSNIFTSIEQDYADRDQWWWDTRDLTPDEPLTTHVNSVQMCDHLLSVSEPTSTSPRNKSEQASLSLDCAKRKLCFNHNKHLPLKKRFSKNFSESSAPNSECQHPMCDLSSAKCQKREKRSFSSSTFIIEETSRSSRARKPLEAVSPHEETIKQLEDLLKIFMSSRKTSSVLMMHSSKQKLFLDYARLCYITAVKIPGGVRLRKTSASRALNSDGQRMDVGLRVSVNDTVLQCEFTSSYPYRNIPDTTGQDSIPCKTFVI